ncbi:MAG: sulfatase [Akkermansiaceae bacterium]|nr:sulfatase [Akkermansiaceae bacterium]MCP5551249.1 sulfatase [Akkermansiaceae bacterium]
MRLRAFARLFGAIAVIGGAVAPEAWAADPKPNVILILADDLGWTDLGCQGSDLYRTPHIDRLAREGMRFTQAYSACTVCSPTRASLMTGKYPARLHITDWIPGRPPANPKLLVPDFTKHLPLEEVTLGDAFHAAGYATASIGKWHLGDEPFHPDRNGFDLNIAGTHAGSPLSGYFAPWKIPTLTEGADGEYLTDRMGAEAVKFIEANAERPFFLYWPHFAVHTPIQGKKEIAARYEPLVKPGGRHQNTTYAAMIESLDEAVGALLDALDRLKLADRTLVVFHSDNGGHLPTTSNAPLRVGKGSCYEGGTRVPLIVRWPGVTEAGSVCNVPVITPDLFPTLLAMASLPQSNEESLDGLSLEPLLRQTGKLDRDALFWHYPHYQLYQQGGTTPYSAIREGDFKLIEFLDDRPLELYDLAADIGEAHNLAAVRPDLATRLQQRLRDWRISVGAQMPTPNPDYDPTKSEHLPTKKPKNPKAPK